MKEIRVEFSVESRKYQLFILKYFLKTEIYLSEVFSDSKVSATIPIKVTTSTLEEKIKHCMFILKRYLVKTVVLKKKMSKETRSTIAIWIAITLLSINQLYGAYQNQQAHQLLWADMTKHLEQEKQNSKRLNQYLEKLNQIFERLN